MNTGILPGVFDILPYDSKDLWKHSHLWQQIEEVIRQIAIDYGYQEIRTPIFERTELFNRGVGATSDIVSKEMYTFQDKGERWTSLRPEGTAPVMRSLIENKLCQEVSCQKVFYVGPMFRYERPQAGRYRQHHQFGVEAIGNKSPEQDVELIDMLYTFYTRLGLKNLQLRLNSIGDIESRLKYRTALQEYLKNHFEHLSSDSKNRFETNPMRILDSKDSEDIKIVANAPFILDFLNEESLLHFKKVQEKLNQLEIPFVICPQLVRGLDYYNNTVFEIVAGELGAQNSIGGGGRYDGLMKMLGGPDLPAIGFGTGLERVIQTLIKQQIPIKPSSSPILYFIPLGEKAKSFCFGKLHKLRQEGLPSAMDFSEKKLNKSMQIADQLKVKFVAIIGENELLNDQIELKEMSTGKIFKLNLNSLSKDKVLGLLNPKTVT